MAKRTKTEWGRAGKDSIECRHVDHADIHVSLGTARIDFDSYGFDKQLHLQASIGCSPLVAKLISRALTGELAKYERKHGAIKLPDEESNA